LNQKNKKISKIFFNRKNKHRLPRWISIALGAQSMKLMFFSKLSTRFSQKSLFYNTHTHAYMHGCMYACISIPWLCLKLFVSLPINENGRVSGGNQAINTLAFEEYLFFVRYQQSWIFNNPHFLTCERGGRYVNHVTRLKKIEISRKDASHLHLSLGLKLDTGLTD
jgi:hypothetical protein